MAQKPTPIGADAVITRELTPGEQLLYSSVPLGMLEALAALQAKTTVKMKGLGGELLHICDHYAGTEHANTYAAAAAVTRTLRDRMLHISRAMKTLGLWVPLPQSHLGQLMGEGEATDHAWRIVEAFETGEAVWPSEVVSKRGKEIATWNAGLGRLIELAGLWHRQGASIGKILDEHPDAAPFVAGPGTHIASRIQTTTIARPCVVRHDPDSRPYVVRPFGERVLEPPIGA